ncbi:hypothetical protein PIB30_080253 [Stylosanthes scabra]|uniref:Uncharacterized protein n=1 Tax=Stylosanthes scabra TaxID=79078 RepID=A0ABU6RR75_9FABA|nr:hypothetical protein [Stylosanthes scabra]
MEDQRSGCSHPWKKLYWHFPLKQTDEECKRLWECVEILQDQQICPCLPWTSSLNPYLEALDLVNYPLLSEFKSEHDLEWCWLGQTHLAKEVKVTFDAHLGHVWAWSAKRDLASLLCMVTFGFLSLLNVSLYVGSLRCHV